MNNRERENNRDCQTFMEIVNCLLSKAVTDHINLASEDVTHFYLRKFCCQRWYYCQIFLNLKQDRVYYCSAPNILTNLCRQVISQKYLVLANFCYMKVRFNICFYSNLLTVKADEFARNDTLTQIPIKIRTSRSSPVFVHSSVGSMSFTGV